MDFKFRLKQNENQNRKTMQNDFLKQNTPQTVNPSGWDKYARQTLPNHTRQNSLQFRNIKIDNQQTSQPQKPQQTNKSSQKLKSNISRYYRSEAAPKNQFKHYLSDINNVFYQQRQSLRKINFYQNIKKVTGILWIILFIFFIIMSFIHPYEGICPHNAECGVFVHCFNGFRYDSQTNQCILSEDFYDHIQSVCIERIIKARQNWGNQQCNSQQQIIPTIDFQQLLIGITNNQLRRQSKDKLEQFLQNQENQQSYHFDYNYATQQIIPKQKKYTAICYLKMFTYTTKFKFGLPIFLIICSLFTYAVFQIRKRVIARKIYQQLRKRTFIQKLLNISYAKPDMEKQYGQIDQKLWELIDQLRSKDRDIGFLQDDFLYWKLL